MIIQLETNLCTNKVTIILYVAFIAYCVMLPISKKNGEEKYGNSKMEGREEIKNQAISGCITI